MLFHTVIKTYISLLLVFLLTACSSGSSSDHEELPDIDVTPDAKPNPRQATMWQPQPGDSWWWQIENSENVDVTLNVDVFDVDLFDGKSSGKIDELKSGGQRVICYFSAGTYEPFRPDKDDFTPGSFIANGALPQFSDENWLNIGDETILETVIKPIMSARLDLAKNAGCDGVEPDNVDGYANDETFGLISAEDQLNYNRWLANEAHARGMSVGLKNDIDQLNRLVDWFDFAVNEQCYAFGNECVAYEATFIAKGKPVFSQEYGASADGGAMTEYHFVNVACPYFSNQNISALWKQTLNLDGLGVRSCP